MPSPITGYPVRIVGADGNWNDNFSVNQSGVWSVRLSDGVAFYNAPTSAQLPAALVGGRLDVAIGAALPAGTENIGDVDVLSLPSGTVAGAASLPAGSATIGAVNLAQYTPVTGRLPTDGSGVTQPVSGTVTANAGTGPFPVSDNSGSLTVDAPVGTPVATRLSDGAAFYNAPTGAQLPAALVGGRLDVVVGAALPTGTANIGDVDIASIAAGDNNIGNVDIVTLPALVAGTANIGDVDVATIAAGTTRIGGVYPVGGNIIDEVPTNRSINRAFVNASASGNTEVVAAQGVGVRIRVIAVATVAGGTAVSVKFQSATTDISALFALAANGGFVLPETPHGWFQTAANEALNVNLSGAVATGVQIIWVQAT